MNYFNFLAFLVVLLTFLCKSDGQGMKPIKCKGKEVKLDGVHAESLQSCLKKTVKVDANATSATLNINTASASTAAKKVVGKAKDAKGKGYKPNACFVACKLESMKAIKDGKIDGSIITKWIKDVFPSTIQDDLVKQMKECEKKLDSSDKGNNCKAFQPYKTCIFKAIKKSCGSKDNSSEEKD